MPHAWFYRFLDAFCNSIYRADGNSASDAHWIERLVNCLAYTISSDLAEHCQVPGFHLPIILAYQSQLNNLKVGDSQFVEFKYSPGLDDLFTFDKAMQALGTSLSALNMHLNVMNGIVHCIKDGSFHGIERKSVEDIFWLTSNHLHILSIPLMDMAVLVFGFDALIRFANHSVQQKEKLSILQNFSKQVIPWICIAKLLQLMYLSDDGAGVNDTDGSGLEMSSSSATVESSIAFPKLGSFFALIEQCCGSIGPPPSSSRVRSCLLEWLSFLRAILHLVCRGGKVSSMQDHYLLTLKAKGWHWIFQPLTLDAVTDDFIKLHLDALGMEVLYSDVTQCDSQGNLFIRDEWKTIENILRQWSRSWIEHCKTAEHKVDGAFTVFKENKKFHLLKHYKYYPSPHRPRLIKLPNDYSKLHQAVLSVCSYEYPALCLLCNSVLNAYGLGQCHAHAFSCGAGTGVFFLLQDCNILLSHGPRCAYFPSPYVDIYGEIHHSYRGKPLHLEASRYDALQALWGRHAVITDIVQKRSSATRVIINGYY